MLTSHLFGRSDGGADYRRVLFGGAGFVPEIESLQMWMEAAWAAGFDREGRAQLGGRVVGTTKCVFTSASETQGDALRLPRSVPGFWSPGSPQLIRVSSEDE